MNRDRLWRIIIRRISTTVPSSMKIRFPSWKSSESVLENANKGKLVAESTYFPQIPKSHRAQLKMDPKLKFLQRRRQLGIGAYALLAIPLTTFGLGCWQVQRRKQKLAKINQIQENAKKEPRELPIDLRELAHMEFAPIRVVGEFCHDEELIIKPRHRHDVYKLAGVMTGPQDRYNEVGAQVITPFKLADRPYKILIQRGWVPLSHAELETRKSGQIEGQVEIVGIVRGNEKRPKFVPENDPLENDWHYRDVEMMARLRNSAPVYLEATSDTTVRGGPIGGQTIMSLRNEHLSYIVTWYSLWILTSWMWYRRYLRPRPLL